MTATIDAPAPLAPARAGRSATLSFLRVLRIELRRSPVVLILPLIVALLWFDSYRPSTAQQPLWALRTFWNMGQGNTIIDFGPLLAGMAAWIGSRDGRRRTADLVITTVRARWTARLATWAATAIWAVGAYLLLVGALFGVYALEGVRGEPPWWWVAVGATAVVAFTAAGFAVGALWPSRFAAPVAAFGGFLAMLMSSQTGFTHETGWALILPTNAHGNYEQQDAGIFYPYLPDLPIARTILLVGILAAFVGLLGLPAGAGGRRLRRVAALVTVAGVALAGTAVGLAGTARLGPYGMVIPALHDAANDRPIAYTPVCGVAAQTPVCLNPAYRRYLADVTAALAPVLTEVAGVPGAPARATQVATTYASGPLMMTIGGSPPVLSIELGAESELPGRNGFDSGGITTAIQFADVMRVQFAYAFVGATFGSESDAQLAVQAALLRRAGIPFADQPRLEGVAQPGPVDSKANATGPVYDAAKRLAALPDPAWRAWLADHVAALRSGALSLDQLP